MTSTTSLGWRAEVDSEMQSIGAVLSDPVCKSLLAEIIWSALLTMKSSPKSSIPDAISAGVSEWVK